MQPRNLFSPVTQESREFRRNKKFISHYAKSNKLTENIATETETIDDEENEDAETSPNLIEGDIAVDMVRFNQPRQHVIKHEKIDA